MKKSVYISLVGAVLIGTSIFLFLRDTLPACGEAVLGATYIGIVTAMELEAKPFEVLIPTTEVCEYGGIVYTVGHLEDKNILLFSSGMGLESAEKAVRLTLSTFTLEMLLLSGIAGGVDTSLQTGETIVAREWLGMATGERVLVDNELIEKAELLEDVRVVRLGATTPTFVTDRSTVPSGVSIVDMETATVALLAEEYEVPFLAIRTISDSADDAGTDDSFHATAEVSAEVTTRFIRD